MITKDRKIKIESNREKVKMSLCLCTYLQRSILWSNDGADHDNNVI